MKVDVLLGLQWGDEGKGKIVDYLAEKYDVVAVFRAARTQTIPDPEQQAKIRAAYHPIRDFPAAYQKPGGSRCGHRSRNLRHGDSTFAGNRCGSPAGGLFISIKPPHPAYP